jgi:hypothetical protein
MARWQFACKIEDEKYGLAFFLLSLATKLASIKGRTLFGSMRYHFVDTCLAITCAKTNTETQRRSPSSSTDDSFFVVTKVIEESTL